MHYPNNRNRPPDNLNEETLALLSHLKVNEPIIAYQQVEGGVAFTLNGATVVMTKDAYDLLWKFLGALRKERGVE